MSKKGRNKRVGLWGNFNLEFFCLNHLHLSNYKWIKIDCNKTDTKNGEIFVMMGVNNKDKSSTETVQVQK